MAAAKRAHLERVLCRKHPPRRAAPVARGHHPRGLPRRGRGAAAQLHPAAVGAVDVRLVQLQRGAFVAGVRIQKVEVQATLCHRVNRHLPIYTSQHIRGYGVSTEHIDTAHSGRGPHQHTVDRQLTFGGYRLSAHERKLSSTACDARSACAPRHPKGLCTQQRFLAYIEKWRTWGRKGPALLALAFHWPYLASNHNVCDVDLVQVQPFELLHAAWVHQADHRLQLVEGQHKGT